MMVLGIGLGLGLSLAIMQASADIIDERVVKRHKTYGKIRLLKTLVTLVDTDLQYFGQNI